MNNKFNIADSVLVYGVSDEPLPAIIKNIEEKNGSIIYQCFWVDSNLTKNEEWFKESSIGHNVTKKYKNG